MIPLVLVHGFMGGSAQWGPQEAHFAGKRPLVALDLPGFGRNKHLAPLNRIGEFADWVIVELRARGIGRYHLLGHSMGGMIVQEIARRDTDHVARLVLYSTGAIGVLPGRFETIAESKVRAATDGTGATAVRIAATWFLDREKAPAFEACAQIAKTASAASIPAGLDAMAAWNGEDALARITAQTLVIWGDGDRTYPWSQTQLLWQSIPGARLAVVPGCAHAVHLEKPAIFNALLDDFLYRQTGA